VRKCGVGEGKSGTWSGQGFEKGSLLLVKKEESLRRGGGNITRGGSGKKHTR